MNIIDLNKPVYTQQEIQKVDQLITKYEGRKETANKITSAALTAILCAVAATAIFYASPILPFSLMVAVPILLAFSLILIVASGGNAPHNIDEKNVLTFWYYTGKFGLESGLSWVKKIYTAKVAIIAGIANGAFAAGALLVAGGAALTARHYEKKLQELLVIKKHMENINRTNVHSSTEQTK